MITKNEIVNIPPQGDINFRERKIEKNHDKLEQNNVNSNIKLESDDKYWNKSQN